MVQLTLSEFISESKQVLDKQREELERELKDKILGFVEENILSKINNSNPLLQGRVKGTSSLSEKIIRKRYADRYKNNPTKFVSELPDLIGLRIVCLLLEEESSIFSSIETLFSEAVDGTYFSIKELKGSNNNLLINHSNQPERQVNDKDIYRLSCKWVTENGLEIFVELQIKSLINMFWGEIEHMLFYKNYAYLVGSSFYTEVMKTIHSTLVTVDSQLQIMSLQLANKTQEEQFIEMKQMFAKLMYNMFSGNFKKELLDTEIEVDLREIYDLMVQIEFRGISTLSKAQSIMSGLVTKVYSNHKFTKDIFQFESYNAGESILKEERKEFGKLLDELSKSNDIYWIAFMGLYKMFQEKPTHTELIDSLANNLMSFYSGFDAIFELLDEGKPGKEIMKKGIEKGIIHVFSSYKKLVFFITNTNQQTALLHTFNYAKSIKDRFLSLTDEEISRHGITNVVITIKAAVSLKVISKLEKKIGIEYLSELYTLLKDKEISGLLFDLNKFKSLISAGKEIKTDSEALVELFVTEKNNGEEE
ncbi:hypothetical protein D3C74_289700 [compost metagenome]